MDIVKKVFPILGVIITIILTVTFRTIPKGKTWENYNILYVKTDTMPANTQNILRDCGIMEYVSIENQRVPIMLSRNSIEETMLKLNLSSAENRYLYDRQNYFYDSKGEYTLFYVPDSYEKQLDQAVQSLTKAGAQAGIDSTLSYMWLIPIVVLALALILAAFSKNKLFFFVTAILPCV